MTNSVSLGPLDYLLEPTGLLSDVTAHGGLWVYVVLFAIIFAETGLVFAPFLPGDSLLFAAGALAGGRRLELWVVVAVVLTAAVAGDAVNYLVGRTFGARITERGGQAGQAAAHRGDPGVLCTGMEARPWSSPVSCPSPGRSPRLWRDLGA